MNLILIGAVSALLTAKAPEPKHPTKQQQEECDAKGGLLVKIGNGPYKCIENGGIIPVRK